MPDKPNQRPADRSANVVFSALGQGVEACITWGDDQVVLWAPDPDQARQLAQQVINRAQEQQVPLSAACAGVHQGTGPYPNLLNEALQDDNSQSFP